MIRSSSDPNSYASILPEVLVKKVHVNRERRGDRLSLDVDLLVRVMPSSPLEKEKMDLIKRSSTAYVVLYDPESVQAGVHISGFQDPTSAGRNRSDLKTRLNGLFPQPPLPFLGGVHRRFDIGSFLKEEACQSELYYSTGAQIYDYTKKVKFKNIPAVAGLKIMVFVHLDTAALVDAMQDFSGVNLDFASGYFNGCYSIGTQAKTTTILEDSKVPEFYTVYVDSNSIAWTGPVHAMRSETGELLYWMKGSTHEESEQYSAAMLSERVVRNSKVIDTRKVESQEPSYYGGNYPQVQESRTERLEKKIRAHSAQVRSHAARGVSVTPPRTQIIDYLSEVDRGNSIGEIYLSVLNSRDLDILFNVNWLEILKRNSPFFKLMPVLSPREVDQVLSFSQVVSVCVKRRRVHPENIGISKFLSRAPKPIENEPPVKVSSNYSMPSYGVTALREIDVVYEDIPEAEHRGIVTFRARDEQVKNLKGVYQYYVEYEFTDGFLLFFENFMQIVEEMESELSAYITSASIPVSFITVDGISQINPNSRGNYNPITGEFTAQFRANIRNNTTAAAIARVFASMTRFVDGSINRSPIDANESFEEMNVTARRMLDPAQGATLETLTRFTKSFLAYKAKVHALISGSSKKQSRRGQNSATTPKGNMPGYIKYVDFFDQTFNTDSLYQPLINYMPPASVDISAAADLFAAMQEEADTFGFDALTDFANGAYLTMHSFEYTPPIPIEHTVEERAFLDNSFAPPPEPTLYRADGLVKVPPVRYQFKGGDSIPNFGGTSENMLRKALSFSGKTSNEAPGQRKPELSYAPPPSVRDKSPDPVIESSYGGDVFSFASDLNTINNVLGATLEIDFVSPSIASIVNNIPNNLWMTEDQRLNQIDTKFDVLKKLTQNHIDQLTNQKKKSKLAEHVVDDLTNISLNSFTPNSSGLLGTINMLSSMTFDQNFESEAIEVPELQGLLTDIPPEIVEDVPPHFRPSVVTSDSAQGVLPDGTLSKYVHGFMVEVKELGSFSKGKKSVPNQSKINTDLGKKNDSTRSNFNKINLNSFPKKGSSNNSQSQGRKYKICKLIPYENREAGIKKSKDSREVTIIGEHFLVEV